MSSGNNEHAVVVGGGIPNLLTARALSERRGAIIVIERDRPPGQPEVRKRVPHARPLHILWADGFTMVERTSPGVKDELPAAGAQPVYLPTALWSSRRFAGDSCAPSRREI